MSSKRYVVPLAVGLLMAACASENAVRLTAGLAGNGSATADVRIELDRGRICWDISDFAGRFGGEITGMHIHSGSEGVVGPVVLAFQSGNDACTEAGASAIDASTLWNIAEHPADFYVDVHTTRHPAGAARGQLRTSLS